MGTRSQVHMINSGVYLYQHLDGYNLPTEIKEALKLKARWDDEEYLTRIIFSTMIKDKIYEETGYGIGTAQHEDIEWLVEIDVEKQHLRIGQGYEDLSTIWNGSFDEFINSDMSEEALT